MNATAIGRAARRAAQIERRLLLERFRPLPRMTVTQWADRFRYLSSEASFRAGKYQSSDAPYQREPMDCMGDPAIRSMLLMWSSQLGKTEMLNNFTGFRIDLDPGPMLVLQPTKEMAEAWSKDRLATMLRDTPRLRGKVADARARDSGNTMLHKSFAGGHLTIVGANSPAGLASRPIRDLLQDEVDRYPPSAGSEGDPSAIAESRQSTFPNRKNIKVSSPTTETGPIWKGWLLSDQRLYFVPCPHCGHEQILEFGTRDSTFGLKWEKDRPETAHYVCRACAAVLEEHDKPFMLANGRWIAQNPDSAIPGFRLSALYSPFFTWASLVERWLRDRRDPLTLRTFLNTILCELWTDDGEQLDAHVLEAHKMAFPRGPDPENDPQPIVPHGVGLLTRSVDVQGDRLEMTVWGWGVEEEAWRVDFQILEGDPATRAPWELLKRELTRAYRHESGASMQVLRTFIDSGGGHTQQVYDFARKHRKHAIFPIKGSSKGEGVPYLMGPKRHPTSRVVWYEVGSYSLKEALVRRLMHSKGPPGDGYIHLPHDIDEEHLDQFLNEKLVPKIVGGRVVKKWIQKGPNEQIDLYCYAFAALKSLPPGTVDKLGELAQQLSSWTPAPPVEVKADPLDFMKQRAARAPRGANYATGWKNG